LGIVSSVNIWKDESRGRFDWSLAKELFVYNDPGAGLARNRSLMIYDDYLEGLNEESPRRAARLSKKLEPMFKLVGR
jgi:hypothetical protein